MGILDVFKKGPPATPGGSRTGRVESYNVADNVGSVRLDSGELLRFGKTACRAFEPAKGVRVLVQAIGPSPLGGERIQVMTLDPADATYENKVAARDSSAVPAPPISKPSPLPTRPIDSELLKRLGNIAAANTLVRGGQDPERLMLAINLDKEEKLDSDRPAVRFQFEASRVAPNHWRLDAGVDDSVAYCRFAMDLELPEMPLLKPATFDVNNAPGFPLTFSRPPDHERNPLARSAFLLAWRVDGGMDLSSDQTPLSVDVTVMGVELTRLDYAYVPTRQPNQHWVLLKCHRGEQSIWLSLDLSTGAGEVFPRRGEVESYKLALDILRTFT